MWWFVLEPCWFVLMLHGLELLGGCKLGHQHQEVCAMLQVEVHDTFSPDRACRSKAEAEVTRWWLC